MTARPGGAARRPPMWPAILTAPGFGDLAPRRRSALVTLCCRSWSLTAPGIRRSVRKRLLGAEPAVAARMVNMSLRRGDAWPGRPGAGSPRGPVSVLILGWPKDGPLLKSNGGEVWPRRVESIAIRRILAPPADALSAIAKPRPHRSRRAPASWCVASRVIFAGTPLVKWSGRSETMTATAGTSSAG